MIVFEGFTKSYGRKENPAVDSLDLEVKDGEILGFAGLNGAGKTTTIRAAAGIILPSSGSIQVDSHDILKDKTKASKQIGWVPEFPNFEPNAKPMQLMVYYAGFYKIKRPEAEKRARELLEMAGLSHALNKKLRYYSQGMKKRFSLASAMISDPQNYMFDETLNGLDPEGIKFTRNLIVKLKNEKKSVFLSSHILSELENLADRIAVINHGKLVKIITRQEIKSLGGEVVSVVVENPDGNLEGVLDEFGTVDISGREITIRNLKISSDMHYEINKRLTNSGYNVSRLDVRGESLEQYFFELVGVK